MKSPLLLAALAAPPLCAAPDTVDTTFASTAGQIFDESAFGGISSSLIQPDGKILFGSNEMPALVGGTPLALPLTRFNPDGSVDHTFHADNEPNGSDSGIYYDGTGWPEVHALGLQSDGKIIAAGVMQGVRVGTKAAPSVDFPSNSIVRFHPDGTIDTGFLTNGTAPYPGSGFNYIEEVTIQPDDKIICVGGFGRFRDSPSSSYFTRHGIARLNADGSLDTGFTISPTDFAIPSGAVNAQGFFRQAAVDPSGKIYVVGEWSWGTSFPREFIPVLARLNADGSRDLAFNPVIPSDISFMAGITLEPDGSVTVLGNRESPSTKSYMARFEASGALSGSFSLAPSLNLIDARPLRRDFAGRYLVSSRSTTSTPANQLIRLNNDGSIDPTFNATAIWTTQPDKSGYFSSFITGDDGRIYSGSFFEEVNGVSTVKVVAFEGDAVPASPGTIELAASAFTTSEEAGTILIPVTRSGGTTGAASIDFSFSDLSATGGADYTATGGTITFADGIGGTKYISVPILSDATAEPSEAFAITLTNPVGAALGTTSTAEVVIVDSDSPPVIVSHPLPVFVPPSGSFILSVGALSGSLPVTYEWFKNGVAIPGATSPLYVITGADAALHDGSYTVTITNAHGSVTSDPAVVTVKDPAELSFSASEFSGLESDGSFSVTLTRSGSFVGEVSVEVSFTDGSADSSDYTGTTTLVTWTNGDSSQKTVNFPLIDDGDIESPETLTVTLGDFSPDAIAGATTSATLTILDDDEQLTITSHPASRTTSEGSSTTFTVAADSQAPIFSYQWYFEGAPIPGATSASYTIPSAAPANSGDYYVVLDNGNGPVTSETATLFVAPGAALIPPGFTAAPTLDFGVNDLVALNDGGVLIAGEFTERLMILDASGANVGPVFDLPDGQVRALARQADGGIIAGGDFFNVNGVSSPKLTRFNPDGSVDTVFAANVAALNLTGNVMDLELFPDGRIAIGGFFTGTLAVLNAEGTSDSSFNPVILGSGSRYINGLDIQPDGKILITGRFTVEGANSMARINPDGSRDIGFATGTVPFNGYGYDILTLADGRVALAYRTSSSGRVSLLNADGSLARNMATLSDATTLIQQIDGKILVGGTFTGGFNRYTSDGTADSAFNSSAGSRLLGSARSFSLGPDGRIWIGGFFGSYNGTAASNLVALNGEFIEPAIIEQPVSLIVDPGTMATYEVGAYSARPVTYQWFKNGIPLSDGGSISGATTATLTLSSVSLTDEADYSVTVSTDFYSASSEAASLLVNDSPRIFSEPAPQLLTEGESLTLSAEVVALSPATFTWTKDGVAITDGGNISGAETAELLIDPINLGDEGLYQLTITNALGTAMTTEIFIEVIPPPAALSPTFADLISNRPNDILPLPDGRTLIAVQDAPSDANGPNTGRRIFVINPDGLVDDSFDFSYIVGNVTGFTRQPDGKIIIIGLFNTISGQPYNEIARLNADLSHDTAFVAGGPNSGQSIRSVALDSQGRIYAAGSFSSWGGDTRYPYLVRLLPDGTLDTSYQPGIGYQPFEIASLSDDRLIVAGSFNEPFFRVGMLNPNGSVDPSFNPNLSGSFSKLLVTPDEQFVYIGNTSGSVRRYHLADGQWDQSFALNPAPNQGGFNDLILQPNGKLLMGGAFRSSTGAVLPYLARVLEDGSPDPLFDQGIGFTYRSSYNISTMALDGEGRIWIGTNSPAYNGTTLLPNGLIVLNGDEVPLDILAQPFEQVKEPGQTATFSVIATGTSALSYQWLKNGTPLANGARISGTTTDTLTITLADQSDVAEYSVEITNESGQVVSKAVQLILLSTPQILSQPESISTENGLEATFRVTGRGVAPLTYQWYRNDTPLIDGPGITGADSDQLTFTDLDLDDSGDIYVRLTNPLGTLDSETVTLLVEKLPASRDRSVILPVSVSTTIYDVLPYDDGSYLIGGQFTSVSHVSGSGLRRYLAKFNSDGTLDSNFAQVSGNGIVWALAEAPDGKIYAGGQFTSLSDSNGVVTRNRIARLNADGTIDTTFDPEGTGPNNTVQSILLLPDGRLLIGGNFNSFNGQPDSGYVCRLNSDGTLDPTFTSDTTSAVNEMALAGNNYWLATSNWNGSQRIVKVDTSGNISPGFQYTGTMTSNGIVLRSDGGVFSYSSSWPYLQSISANGTIESPWPNTGSGQGPSSRVYAGALVSGGRAVIAGQFTVYGGENLINLAAINPDGSLVPGFDPGSGFNNGQVRRIKVDSLGRLWIVGAITTYKGESIPRMVVLNGLGLAPPDPFLIYLENAGVPEGFRGPNDDPDGDGNTNLLEYLYGSNPAVADWLGVYWNPVNSSANGDFFNNLDPGAGLDPTKRYRIVHVRTPLDEKGLTVELEAGLNLQDFGSGSVTVHPFGTPTNDGSHEIRTYYLTPSMNDARTQYWRLKVRR